MRKAKMNAQLLSILSVTGGFLGILEIAYPIICDSFKSFSFIRLHRLGNQDKTAIITGYWEHNVGRIYYLTLLIASCGMMRMLMKNIRILRWGLLTGMFVFLDLLVYLVCQDYPHPSPWADLLSELMMLCMFCSYFPVLNEYLADAIVKRAFDHRFWLIGGIYTGLYLFLCPALLGDAITIVNILSC